MARAALKWTVQDLATYAAISKNTVVAVEAGRESHAATLAAIERALEQGGVEFIAENGGGPGVRLAKRDGGPNDDPGCEESAVCVIAVEAIDG